MLDRLFAARRRRRAEELIDLGNPVGLDFDFPDSAPVHLDVLFLAEGSTLVMKIVDLKPVGTGEDGVPEVRPVGVKNVLDCRHIVERIAADAGYERLRITGLRRSRRRNRFQTVDVDLPGTSGRGGRRR